ncbi:MAG: polysaccharide biosynthesis tyrosine autokinase [Ignavibacteriaceae bacterium]|nr:polysaccharide biosynthesis tyrosine autokinase [Ignavibacteriaceae bacterium]
MKNEKHHSALKTSSFKDYADLIRSNFKTVLVITAVFFLATTFYAIIAPNIYTSTVSLKISAPKANILSSKMGELQDFSGLGSDRYIANEIETIYNSTILGEVAEAVVDSYYVSKKQDDFNLIFDKGLFKGKANSLKDINHIAGELRSSVVIQQKGNLDFIDITSESQSPQEAALIANIFAKKYLEFNLLENRRQVTVVKEFLSGLLKEKREQLYNVEDAIREYQLQKGGVQLDRQAQMLITKLADFESQKNITKVNMAIAKEKLNQYKSELEKKDPTVSSFLTNKSSEPYLQKLQDEIASLETQRDVALASSKTARSNEAILSEYNSKINALKDKLDKSLSEYRNQILSSSPTDIKELSQKIFEEEINYQSLNASYSSLSNVLGSYESEFNQLPSSTLEFARLERQRMAEENLYNILNNKYQEAQLNEQATPGNVFILNKANPSTKPSKPNRSMIIIMGLFLGLGFAFGFVYIKNYFDKTIKTPEDIEAQNANVLAWIPKISAEESLGLKNPELIVAQKPDSLSSEAFRTIRTRLQFSHITKGAKVILVTSSAPGEGKTTVSTNLAASFAQANKRSVIVDCDLRKPRIAALFGDDNSEGFLDYLFGRIPYEKIIKKTEVRNLDFINGGSIPPNPSEILGSPVMKAFIDKLKNDFDIVIIDSPPIMAVSDSEILARFVDICLLVVSANTSEIDWLKESISLLKQEHVNLAGVLLNNFNYRSGYHSYYKYYDQYAEKYGTTTKKGKSVKSI